MVVFNYFNFGDKGENINYWFFFKLNVFSDFYEEDGISENKRGRSRLLRLIDEFFFLMCRLR